MKIESAENFKHIIWTLMIDDRNRYFERYLYLIKNTVDEDEKTLSKKANELKDTESVFHEDYGRFDPKDELSDMAYEMSEMEQLMYRSFVVEVFIFMESQITYVCESVKKIQSQKFSYRDLNRSGVGRSIDYIEKVLDIKFPINDNTRQTFKTAWVIRNALVHREGEIKDEEIPIIKKYMAQNAESLKLDNKKIVITYNYAKSLIALNEKVCKELQEQNKVKFSKTHQLYI